MSRGVRISLETREEILARLKVGERSADLALEYGLSEQTIGRMSRRFSGRIFKSPPLPLAAKVGAVPACEFVEVKHSVLPVGIGGKKLVPARLEISVKSGETSLEFDVAANNEQLGLIFKLIGSLC
jgi:hypothetical protein